ncbi:MAG: hypothetical protein LBK26_00905 [Rickettsiales bacterium]|nr:hypothetical protein [Rickettsiales bacterium]
MADRKKISAVCILAVAICIVAAAAIVSRRTQPPLEQMVGQMLVVGFFGMDANPKLISEIRAGRIGGVVLYSKTPVKREPYNIKSVGQVKDLADELQSAAEIPLFISIDQEGGDVQRLTPEYGFQSTPAAREMGRGKPEDTYAVAHSLGRGMRAIGLNLNYAPVLDIYDYEREAAMAEDTRSFGNNAVTVMAHGQAFANGLAAAGVVFCYKHFPGYGRIKYSPPQWGRDDLRPFAGLSKSGMFGMVMVGHLYNMRVDPVYPASMSKKTMDILRNEIGFNGVVITDGIDMPDITDRWTTEEFVRKSLTAGIDILLIENWPTYDSNNIHEMIMKMVKSGEIPASRIRESYRRIMKLKKRMQNL